MTLTASASAGSLPAKAPPCPCCAAFIALALKRHYEGKGEKIKGFQTVERADALHV